MLEISLEHGFPPLVIHFLRTSLLIWDQAGSIVVELGQELPLKLLLKHTFSYVLGPSAGRVLDDALASS